MNVWFNITQSSYNAKVDAMTEAEYESIFDHTKTISRHHGRVEGCLVNILEKIDRVITTWHYTLDFTGSNICWEGLIPQYLFFPKIPQRQYISPVRSEYGLSVVSS